MNSSLVEGRRRLNRLTADNEDVDVARLLVELSEIKPSIDVSLVKRVCDPGDETKRFTI